MTFNLLSQLTDRSTKKEDEDEGSPVDDVGVEIDDESDVNFDVEEGEVDGLHLDSSNNDESEYRSTNREDEDEGSPVDDVGVETNDESDVNFDVEEGEVDGLHLDSSNNDESESSMTASMGGGSTALARNQPIGPRRRSLMDSASS
ncbi:hypothetical protein PoB_004598900 [Plakobranchus ocellatus]|uniref:Uncharacterized protein n=1 Tax=Plakobranchus ocellatus TaxID=259542 RepID=A0AAV4BMD9_9GAST|nr:hypothetical protein PoB_004598900 [Plakobranchus ocellatus]